jgi:hypothetical protein
MVALFADSDSRDPNNPEIGPVRPELELLDSRYEATQFSLA